jgi:hypothetical protein
MAFQPLPHTIVAFDMIGSGRLDNPMLLQARQDMRALAAQTLAEQGIDILSIEVHDLDDGLRLVVPSVITPVALVHPLIANLDVALRLHRQRSSEQARLRLRVAAHHGLVRDDGGLAIGESLRIITRLLDAALVRQAARLSPEANLFLVVSQQMYEFAVRPGYALDPGLFQLVAVAEKETTTTAWLYVPGYTPHLALHEPLATPVAQPGDEPGCERSAPTPPTAQSSDPRSQASVIGGIENIGILAGGDLDV